MTMNFANAVKAAVGIKPPATPPRRNNSASTSTPASIRTRSRSVDMHDRPDRALDRLNRKHSDSQRLTEPSKSNQAMVSALAEQKRLIKKYEKKLDDVAADKDALRERLQDLSKAYHESQQHCTKLEEQLEARERDIRNLQSQKLQSVESAQWAPLPSSSIQHDISSILTSVRQWSQQYSNEGKVMTEPTKRGEIFNILIALGCVSASSSRASITNTMFANNSLKKSDKAASFLLSTIASSYLLQKVLADPLFFFQDPSFTEEPDKYQSVLNDVQAYIAQGNREDAEALRCHLVRSIATSSKHFSAPQGALIQGITDTFTQIYARPFIADQDMFVSMHNSFASIVEKVIGLAWKVWTRKARLDVLPWSQLSNGDPFGDSIAFSSDSDKLDLHAMHGRDIDEDPQALDDHEVVVVCSPAVVMAGNAEGKDYQKQRVVKKAVVWLG